MAEHDFCPAPDKQGFKEAVCIDAMRIYDSCSDKDCLEDIRVLFPKAQQELVNCATNVRIRDVEEAQQRIVGIIRDLEERSELIILKGGKDDIIA